MDIVGQIGIVQPEPISYEPKNQLRSPFRPVPWPSSDINIKFNQSRRAAHVIQEPGNRVREDGGTGTR